MVDILIVEDEKNMQDIICEYMRRGGHTCLFSPKILLAKANALLRRTSITSADSEGGTLRKGISVPSIKCTWAVWKLR